VPTATENAPFWIGTSFDPFDPSAAGQKLFNRFFMSGPPHAHKGGNLVVLILICLPVCFRLPRKKIVTTAANKCDLHHAQIEFCETAKSRAQFPERASLAENRFLRCTGSAEAVASRMNNPTRLERVLSRAAD
jgi:hypothetical protein